MLAVLLLAAYIRIHNLNEQGIWGDEGWSIWLARGDSVRDLTMTMVVDHHGPVYSTLLRAWDLVAGGTILALRYITVLFSITSIALIYRLGRALFTPTAGVLAALAFTLMDKQVVLTQEVRDYPIIYFAMIGTAYFYVRWRCQPRGGNAFGFVAFSIFGLYLQYYCYMVNLALLAHALLTIRNRPQWKHFIAQNALIALAFLPWIGIVVHQFVNTPVDEEVLTTIHGLPFNRHTIEYLATESFGKPVALFGMLFLVGSVAPLIRTPGPMSTLPRQNRISNVLLAVLWFAVPLLITFALHSQYPLLTDRNISVIMPAIALLVGFGLTAFDQFGMLFLALLITADGVLTTDAYFVKPPWRQMAADIRANYPPGEIVLVDVEGDHAALWYHLLLALPAQDRRAVINRLPAEDTHPTIVSLHDLRKRYQGDFTVELQKRIADTPGLWLGYWGDEAKKHDTFDILEASGFVRTATRAYAHHGYPIFAYRYDRVAALQDPLFHFGDSITLRRFAATSDHHPGDTAHVMLWWVAASPLPADYTVSVFLLDANGFPLRNAAGSLLVQHDAFPSVPTSQWEPGSVIFDNHPLALPDTLPPGIYQVGLKLYDLAAGTILPVDGQDYIISGKIQVK